MQGATTALRHCLGHGMAPGRIGFGAGRHSGVTLSLVHDGPDQIAHTYHGQRCWVPGRVR